ncbi:PAS domain-containing protein [Bradyrhizobium guangdongense]|uniref:PAS domain-containing protein n=1 Tax=Bradyrhizobium guangdongense TaxID=1325090 RepID=A0A410V438_9BRAD|nr:PAS domain-containing protein [Bradyrhizobium guangdongense]QAU38408.1 hypothetical protein X265_12520 [Bradyrhizobium guangdongense]QOZ59463.1 hypothetical protein XH86_12515 [Bradyrhizobium guangdongense]GGI33002.1 hypothetical protein GCM10010987_72220 [Bradyrhizobium guangdongense]
MDFQSQTPAVVTAIRQRDLLITWCRLYARTKRLPNLSEYEPGRLKEEAEDLVYYSVDATAWPPVLTIESEGTRMATAYGQTGKGRRLDEYVGPRLAASVMPVYHLCVARRCPVYTVSHLEDADGRKVAYERLLLPFGADDEITELVASLKTISPDGRFDLRNLMTRTDLVAAPAVRAVIDRGLVGGPVLSAGWADDLEFG